MEKLRLTWDECEQLSEKLFKKIDFSFDQILCISRGGLFLGRLLSEYSKKPLAVISVKSYEKKKKGALKIGTVSFLEELKGNILIVDDVVDSGETFSKVVAHVKDHFPCKEIKTASIFLKNNPSFKPDFFVEEREGWIIFPYEKS